MSEAYQLEGNFFVCRNGGGRYNRPLYGRPGRFFTYAGDRPEWALSRRGKTGNLLVGILRGKQGKWLIDADTIIAKYCPGTYVHEISDRLLDREKITIQSVAMHQHDGLLLQIGISAPVKGLKLIWAFGGISDLKDEYFGTEYDTNGYDHESHFFPRAEDSRGNKLRILKSGFRMRTDFGIGFRKRAQLEQYREMKKQKPYYGISGTSTCVGEMRQVDSTIFENICNLKKRNITWPLAAEVFSLGREPRMIGVRMMRDAKDTLRSADLQSQFVSSLASHEQIRNRVRVHTPDAQLNAFVPALNASADALWDEPFMTHGGVAWHQPYIGWRSIYSAIALGWWDRAEAHFSAFAKTQIMKSAPPKQRGMAMDVDTGYTRVRKDSVFFSRGRIENQFYNMQEGMIDQIIRQILYSGDERFLKKFFPVIEAHLDWEKRCFDPDDDGLYENFANTHISDAHGYNGAGCAQASAYACFANSKMADFAVRLGKSPDKFRREAAKIKRALNGKLWMSSTGAFAECLDTVGKEVLHDNPELPSLYHPIDSEVTNPMQAYQVMQYVARTYEHVSTGDGHGEMAWSSNWTPWFWSTRQLMINENSHLALAGWTAGCRERAYRYFMGGLIDSMLESKTPGHVIGTSPRDMHQPFLATDFGCGIGIAARALVEGLFGVRLNSLDDSVVVAPGFPEKWQHAGIETPYLTFDYRRNGKEIVLRCTFHKALKTVFKIPYPRDALPLVQVNGKTVRARLIAAPGSPRLEIAVPKAKTVECIIQYAGKKLTALACPPVVVSGGNLDLKHKGLKVLQVSDPQKCLAASTAHSVRIGSQTGHHTFFVKLRQHEATWYQPMTFEIRKALEITQTSYNAGTGKMSYTLRENISGHSRRCSTRMVTSLPGTQTLCHKTNVGGKVYLAEGEVPAWTPGRLPDLEHFESLDIGDHVNLDIENLFTQEYHTPRSPHCSYMVHLNGFGAWTGSPPTPVLSSLYFARRVDRQGRFITRQGIPFKPANWKSNNAVMVSQWDNFPSKVAMNVARKKADRLYFLLAGSCQPLSSQMDNAVLRVVFTDKTVRELLIHNPKNYWPIWGDLDIQADSFCLPEHAPQRVLIGANTWANLIDMEVSGKIIEKIEFECLVNEIAIGLLGITLGHELKHR